MTGLLLARLACAAAAFVFASGPGDLASLKEGQAVGAYRAKALYLDSAGAPKGARFLHPRGAVVDVLFFDSVPQVSVSFAAPPDDERGAPHTLEHLLFGKGETGRRLKTLMPMRMGTDTAGTGSDETYYQFSSAAGPDEFYELLGLFIDALVRPDFTDEEIRREVAHDVVLEENGALKLEEAGTVYTEMVSRMEQSGSVVWDQLGRMLYGPTHPLARNQGGEPEQIWKLAPSDIRAFHAAHYHLDGRMELLAALPMTWSASDFLARLDELIRRAEPGAPAGEAAPLPPFRPLAARAIRIDSYPSQDASTPQTATFGWPPVRLFSNEEKVRLDMALELLSGDLPFLSGDYLDKVIHKTSPGAPSVGMSIGAQSLPASIVWAQISGLQASSVSTATLAGLRDAVMERIRWLHDLKPGAPNLIDLADKAKTRIRARRRASAQSMQGPPRLGERSTDDGWHRALDHLATEPGFAKHIDETADLDRLLADIDAGANPWAAVFERAGLLELPYISAALPDHALQESQKLRKAERLKTKTKRLAAAYRTPEPEALERFRVETASVTVALESRERGQARPSFLREPPLELDRIDWNESRLTSGPPLVATRFDTPFTDVSIAFDLNGIDARDRELLPILATAVRGVGVVTATGEQLDGSKAYDRVAEEIQGAEVDVSVDANSDRAELVFTAHASSSAEIAEAVGWLGNYILRHDLSLQSREGLKAGAIASIQNKRGIFQEDEENWISYAAAAYLRQDRPMYMHSSSPFTTLRDVSRLRWRLEEPSRAMFDVIRSTAAIAIRAADAPDRAEAALQLQKIGGEIGETLRWEFAHLPDDSWRRDLKRIVVEYLDDLGHSQDIINRLQAMTSRVLVRAGARVRVNGSPANVELAAKAADALLAPLPLGKAARPPERDSLVLRRLRDRLPGLDLPTHVALVNDSGKTGSISVASPAPNYRSLGREDLLDVLALGVLSGGSGHSLYMRTWNAGLAYGNGMSHWPSVGLANYYADKCPDPSQTLRFVAGVASSFKLDDPFYLESSLADAFNGYRAAQDFSSRGAALADDLRDGNRPEVVRAFKSALLRLAREPGTLDAVRARFQPALGRVLIGLPGGKVARPGASAFFVGPEELIKRHEDFLKERGEASRVIRLYPRDFWP
ncbi:MAG: insulinase family protein [Elusimicrobia bacterium]|nr:insulinase family protein [Elusimicrobiota bacterium]